MKNLIKLFLRLIGFISFLCSNVHAQCDPQMEYQSRYFHGNPYVFTPANTDKIEDSVGNFYEILFFENSIIKDGITFNSTPRSPYLTSGVLISKFDKSGTKIFSKLSALNLSNIPITDGLRGGTNFVTIQNDTLVMFSLLGKGNYQTFSGDIDLPFNIFAKISFSINDGSLMSITPLITSDNANFSVAFQTFSMTMDGQEIYFSFVPISSTVVLMNGDKTFTDPKIKSLFVGSYNIKTNSIQIKKLLTSKKAIIPRELTLKNNNVYVTGIYTDTAYLPNGDTIYPRFPDPRVFIANDGYVLKTSKDFSLLDYRSIRGIGDVKNIQIKNGVNDKFYLLIQTTSQKLTFEKKGIDTSIDTKPYNLIGLNSSLKLLAVNPIENNNFNPDDFVIVEMITNQKNDFVLSIATNGKNIIIGTDTLNTIKNSSNIGITHYHLYFNSDGKKTKHQVYYGEGFFQLAPIITDENYTYIQGSTSTDIAGSYDIKMPKDAPLNYMTFYEKVCTEKLLHTSKSKEIALSKIYPNPSHTSITIENSEIISAIEIADLMGKVVYQNKVVNEFASKVDVSHLTNGMYVVKYLSDGKWKVAKIVKQ